MENTVAPCTYECTQQPVPGLTGISHAKEIKGRILMANGKGKTVTEARGRVFGIPDDNAIAAYAAEEVPDGLPVFSSETELRALLASWPARKLTDIWNRLPGVIAVSKFKDRNTALRRIWQAVNRPESAPPSQNVVAHVANARKAAKGKQRPKEQDGTKSERIIALLKQPEGATLKAIMAATGWQAHSVRGFISGQLTKRMGLKVKSFKRDDERVYRVRP
jgi:hypothetical protein